MASFSLPDLIRFCQFPSTAKHTAHRSKIADAASRQAGKEEALINEAVSEAMSKVEEKTGEIVKHAVQTAVKKAVGQVKEGGEVAQKLMHGQQVDKAAIAEKVVTLFTTIQNRHSHPRRVQHQSLELALAMSPLFP